MFRAILLPILRSIRLYNTTCTPDTLPVGDLVTEELTQFLCHQITNQQHIGYNIPQAVVYSLMLLRMGKSVTRNMSS